MHELPALRYMQASNKGVAKIVIGFVAKGVEKTLDETSRRYKNETGQDYVVPDYFKQRMQKNFYAMQKAVVDCTIDDDRVFYFQLNKYVEKMVTKLEKWDKNYVDLFDEVISSLSILGKNIEK